MIVYNYLLEQKDFNVILIFIKKMFGNGSDIDGFFKSKNPDGMHKWQMKQSSFSPYVFLPDLPDLEMDFYYLLLYVLIIW